MADPVAICVWIVSPPLVVAVHERLGPPVDAYDNGSQTWLRGDGPDGVPIEWRLHPRHDFARPGRLSSYHLFPAVAGALARGEEPPMAVDEVWAGLDATSAFGDGVDPTSLCEHVTAVLGRAPDAFGLLDRGELRREWERSLGRLDVVAWTVDVLTPTD